MFVMSYTVPSAVHACRQVQPASESHSTEVVKQQGRLQLTECPIQPCTLQSVLPDKHDDVADFPDVQTCRKCKARRLLVMRQGSHHDDMQQSVLAQMRLPALHEASRQTRQSWALQLRNM